MGPFLVAFAVMASTAGVDSTSPATSGPAAVSAEITFRVCNHTDKTVLVAGTYTQGEDSSWRNKGWTPISPDVCADVFKTDNRTFYARAEQSGDSDVYWGTDARQCIEYPGPFDFYTPSDEAACSEGQLADFTKFRSDGSPIYVWTLNPAK